MDVTRIGILSFWILTANEVFIFVCAKPLGNVDNNYGNKTNTSEYSGMGNEGDRTTQTTNPPDLKLLSPNNSTMADEIEFNTTSEIGALASEGIEQAGEWTTIIIIGLFVATCLIKGLPVLILRLMYGPAPKLPKDKSTIKEDQSAENSSGVNNTSEVTEISSCDSECSAREICDQIKNCTKL